MYKLLFALALMLPVLAPSGLHAQGKYSGLYVTIQSSGGPGHFCLDSRKGEDQDGAPVQIFPCNNMLSQHWAVTASQDNKHAVIGKGGYCLDVRGENSTQNGTPAQLWSCHFGENQRFMFNPDGRIVEVRSGKCLVISAPQEGAPVLLAPCRNLPGEVWLVVGPHAY